MAFVRVNSTTKHEVAAFERWKIHHSELLGDMQKRQSELFDDIPADEQDEDVITEEMLEAAERLERDEFDVPQILSESLQDLNQIAEFLNELRQFKPSHDDKLRALIHLLKNDPVLKKHKVMIFSEFMATARYLATELKKPVSKALTRSTQAPSSVAAT